MSGRFSNLGNMIKKVGRLLVDVENDDIIIRENAIKICKLLYYTVPDPLNFKPGEYDPKFETREDVEEYILHKRILLVPRIPPPEERGGFIVVIADDFRLSDNKKFKVNTLTFDVLCHYENWILKDSMRPFLIMQCIDEIFNNRKLSIGNVEFYSAKTIVLTQYLLGYQLIYVDASFD